METETQVFEGVPAEILLPKPPTDAAVAAGERPIDPLLFLNGFGAVRARKVVIASVHFMEKRIRFWHSGRRTFVLPACKDWKPTYCPVFDSQQAVQTNNGENGAEFAPMPVPVETIVRDCVETWGLSGTGVIARHRAGIMAIQGETCTAAELAQIRTWQESLDRALVEEADRFHAEGKGLIEEHHRLALAQLGSERRAWFKPIEYGNMKTSIISGNRIPMEALADGGIDLLEYYVKHDLNPSDFGDTFAAILLEKDGRKIRRRIEERLRVAVTPTAQPIPVKV